MGDGVERAALPTRDAPGGLSGERHEEPLKLLFAWGDPAITSLHKALAEPGGDQLEPGAVQCP